MKRTVPSDVAGEIKSLVLKQESWYIEKQKCSLSHASAMMLLLRVKEKTERSVRHLGTRPKASNVREVIARVI